jgi:predicted transcriptional regulator
VYFKEYMRSIKEIKNLRKKYNLTQKELAERANVSQSLIAKIEAGRIDPSFSKAKQIFSSLQEIENKNELKAKDVMQKKVSFAKVNDSIRKIIMLMKKKGISQIPVLSKNKIVGMINESLILKEISENPDQISQLKIGDIMEDAPPIVTLKTGLNTIIELLKDYQVILVSDKGDVLGIISKSDILGRIE